MRRLFVDLYGTITSADRAVVMRLCAAILSDTADAMPAEELARRWGDSLRALLDVSNGQRFRPLKELEAVSLTSVMGDRLDEHDAMEYVEEYHAYCRSPSAYPDALRFVARHGKDVCLVSNSDRCDALAAIGALGIRCAHVVTSEDAQSYKPDVRIFQSALRVTGWNSRDVVHIGDSIESDVVGARRAGIAALHMKRDSTVHDSGGIAADWVCTSFGELDASLERMGSRASRGE